MKKIIIKLYSLCRNLVRACYWKIQGIYLKRRKKPIVCNRINLNEKILILLPHADDEWIGASTFISNQHYNITLCNMDMSGGDSEELHICRHIELKKISQLYDRKLISYCKSLSNIIDKENPKYIMLPFFLDWHPDHIELMKLLNEALGIINNNHIMILMYQVSLPIPQKFITHVNSLSKKEWKKKWHIFKEIYITQSHIPYKRFAINEYINGKLCNSYAAEVFSMLPSSKWKEMYENIKFDDQNKLKLKNSINDLIQLHKIIESLKFNEESYYE